MSGPTVCSALTRRTAPSNWSAIRRTCLPTLSSIAQSRSYSKSRALNYNGNYLSPAERAEQRRKEQADAEARAMDKNFTREWNKGDVYAPHDLSAAEARKWRKRHTPTVDAFDALSMDPLDCYKNFAIMSEYMTDMGRIRHSNSTGLRWVNQRKIAKAIRRAIALGLMPSVHRHPEILALEMRKFGQAGYT